MFDKITFTTAFTKVTAGQARVAQWLEHSIHNAVVVGPNPTPGTFYPHNPH